MLKIVPLLSLFYAFLSQEGKYHTMVTDSRPAPLSLRVGEVLKLKVEDIDSKRMLVHIKGAKGRKDRYENEKMVVLSF